LAAYNNLGTDVTTKDELPIRNGRINTTFQDSWQFRNVGQVYNRFSYSDNDIYQGSVSSNFDIVPSSGKRHQIQFGINYEQRAIRSYVLNPFALYYEGGLLANYHFNGYQDGERVYTGGPNAGQKRLSVIGKQQVGPFEVDIYARDTSLIVDAKFPYALRTKLNKSVYDYVNIDNLNPSQLSLDMFSARELTDRQVVNYYGYDYLGNRLGNDVTFNDFFTKKDASGVRTFPVAAIQPIYAAAYVQDKFTYEKMIFRLGLRVDRYDANTKVMKDIYSLYDVQGAQDFFAQNGGTIPGTVNSNDYKVYVNSLTAKKPQVVGFRKGEQWYYADGSAANDGKFVFASSQPIAYYSDANARSNKEYIKSPDFKPESAFEDYTPQVNFMPRLAFSFPISDEANFFANYDVLVSRPTSDPSINTNIATALDYLYFYDAGRTTASNPNLKPQKTVYYEVGFQQKLTEVSALKVTAYYKELRDMIQRRSVLFVPNITNYETFGNIDFGTVKGFTLGYDRRRENNISLMAAYTLQFADATGSDANSQRNLTERGNLRTIYPLSFDERHNLQASIDYRFDSGSKYNGPRIAGLRFLEDFGVNLAVSAVSGEPYTAKEVPDRFGGAGTLGQINGARLPWKYRLDLRFDKEVRLNRSETKPLSMNVFLRIQNVLNTRNVINVYSASGSATNDGYLASERGTQELAQVNAQGFNAQAFLDAYNWALINPGNFTLPRRIFLGAAFSF
jgi:outer membrane receptor protein involved in Fe transport